jgi:chromate reductase, NAD(P)H dehydrogenase (quinone)
MAEYSAGAGLGVSKKLTTDVRTTGMMSSRSVDIPPSCVVRHACPQNTRHPRLAGGDVTRVSLVDYPLPIYDADSAETSAPPQNAVKLKQMMSAHQGVFIASPEYNASISPLLKNAIDWISAVRERGDPPLAAFQDRVFALGGASPGRSGAACSLLALRQVLAVGCRALVIAEQVSIASAEQAFNEMDELRDARVAEQLRVVVRKLVDIARLVA